jgi:hypothetical protein
MLEFAIKDLNGYLFDAVAVLKRAGATLNQSLLA